MFINKPDVFKVVCLFARDCGVKALEGLLNDKRFIIAGLLVHSRLPKSEDPNRGIRPEFHIFKEIAYKHSIPLSTIDTREDAKNLAFLRTIEPFDFLISLSWRFLVPKEILQKARIAALNAHRGKLPTYAGAEPIKRAIENNEKYAVLTVHEMVETIDAGKVIIEKAHRINYDSSKTLEENIEEVKKEILPLYPEAIIEAIDKVLETKEIRKCNEK